jgi:CIC family chloride channel protein
MIGSKIKKKLPSQWGSTIGVSERTSLVLLGALIGALAALGNAAFRLCMQFYHHLFFERYAALLGITNGDIRRALIVLLPVTGALIVGLVVCRMPEYIKGYGMPRLLLAVARKGGRIKARVVPLNITIPTLVIGSGGSAGREGPIAALGGALGSVVAQIIHSTPQRMRVLVASGAGAAIAAAFDAPIAGMMFALEIVLLGNFDIEHFPPVVISAGVATVLTEAIYGESVTFKLPPFRLENLWVEIPSYVILGFVVAFLAILFIKIFYLLYNKFEELNMHLYLKILLGAFLVGIMGIFLPQVMGNGYPVIEDALQGNMAWGLVTVLIFAKMASTSFTVGSGSPGGLFAPALYIGCMIGASFGGVAHHLFPTLSAPPGAYASVGMGAFLGAACHAPLTGIFLLFEMTRSYQIMLPAIFSAMIGALVAERMLPYSIDTYGLAKAGIILHHGREKEILETLKVKDAISSEFDIVWEGTTLKGLKVYFRRFSRHADLFVEDHQERLVGVIPFAILKDVIFRENLEDLLVAKDLAITDIEPLKMEDSLMEAMRKFGRKGIDHLPVIDDEENRHVIGIVTRRSVIEAYNREQLRRPLG